MMGALVVAALCGVGIVRYVLGYIQHGKRPPQVGREVRAKLGPGLALGEALALAYAAARNEPATTMGNPIALVWAHCTSTDSGTRKGPLDGFARDTRVFMFNARESASAGPAGGLPPTVFLDQPGANPTDSAVAVDWLGQCPEVEIVFESGFFGWVYLPLTLTPEGRVESIGEVRTGAK
ncbi:MAG TPA: hypothetical protein VI669_07140 [Vicinamibacteria bacterium]